MNPFTFGLLLGWDGEGCGCGCFILLLILIPLTVVGIFSSEDCRYTLLPFLGIVIVIIIIIRLIIKGIIALIDKL